VLWADPEQRAVLAVDKHTGGEPVVLGRTRSTPLQIVADQHDVFVLCEDPSSSTMCLEHLPARGGPATVVASYERPLDGRPSLVMDRRAVYIAAGDRVLRLARA
jgi:hypothetical protein